MTKLGTHSILLPINLCFVCLNKNLGFLVFKLKTNILHFQYAWSGCPLKTLKKKCTYFVYGKPGHHAPQCRKRVKTGNSGNPPKANLVEGDGLIVVVSQANMVTNSNNLVVDSGAIRHIYANRDAFASYTSVGDDEKVIYFGDSHTA